MKKLLLFLLTFLFVTRVQAGLDTLLVKTSAQCGTCKETLESGMSRVKGVVSVQLDIDSKYLQLVYDPDKTNPTKLRKAVSRIGYDADGIPADLRAYKRLPGCCQKGGHDTR